MKLPLALATLVCTTIGAGAAELPVRAAKSPPPESKAKTCEIGGERGFVTPGGGCVRIGGYVSVGVTSGGLRNH